MTISSPKEGKFPALCALWQEAFGDTEDFLDAFFNTAFSEKRCRCVFDGEEIVAALYWFDCSFQGQKIAYIYAVATKKSHRGKGICKALMEDTHRHLRSEGYAGAVLVPGNEELFGFYEKLGYKICCFSEKVSCTASDEKIDIKPIDENEFAKMRRQFLPKGGIVQEKENLAFLKTMASFYSGNGFLLTAHLEGEKLCGIELLGDETLAPKIVKAFGCKTGMFKIPAKSTPFAMFFSLKDNAQIPDYLGFAFN